VKSLRRGTDLDAKKAQAFSHIENSVAGEDMLITGVPGDKR
jgi:hypothetical protein